MLNLLSSDQVIEEIRGRTDTILLAFSCGKDSIGLWLEMRKHFPNIVPYYMYLVPDLEFIEKSLIYYEAFFGCKIVRLPHPSLYRMLRNFVFQPPEHCSVIEAARLPKLEYFDIQQALRDSLGLGAQCYAASGVRAVDSPQRMMSLRKRGAINDTKRQFFGIWDWNKARLVDEITAAGVRLPVDYKLFGRSFDGLDYRFLKPIRDAFPRDFGRILEYFPLADIEIKRREFANA